MISLEWTSDGNTLILAYHGYYEPSDHHSSKNVKSQRQKENQNKLNGSYQSCFLLYDINTTKVISCENLTDQIVLVHWRVKQNYASDEFDCDKLKLQPIQIDLSEGEVPLDTLNVPFVNMFCDESEYQKYLTVNQTMSKHFKAQNNENVGKNCIGKMNNLDDGGSGRNVIRTDFYESYQRIVMMSNFTFSVLVVGTNEGKILFFAFGIYKLFEVDLNSILVDQHWEVCPSQMWLSNSMSCLQVLLEPIGNQSSTQILSLECELLSQRYKDFYVVSSLRSHIHGRLQYIGETLGKIGSIWEDLIAEIDSKLSNYMLQKDERLDKRKESDMDISEESASRPKNTSSTNSPISSVLSNVNVNDDNGIPTSAVSGDIFTPRTNKVQLEPDEFLEMLVFGEISLSLERFLVELNEKGLKKLCSSIEGAFMSIHKTNINDLQRALYHIYSYATILKGKSLAGGY